MPLVAVNRFAGLPLQTVGVASQKSPQTRPYRPAGAGRAVPVYDVQRIPAAGLQRPVVPGNELGQRLRPGLAVAVHLHQNRFPPVSVRPVPVRYYWNYWDYWN